MRSSEFFRPIPGNLAIYLAGPLAYFPFAFGPAGRTPIFRWKTQRLTKLGHRAFPEVLQAQQRCVGSFANFVDG